MGARFSCDVLWAMPIRKVMLSVVAVTRACPLVALRSFVLNQEFATSCLASEQAMLRKCHLGDLHLGKSVRGLEPQSLEICQALGLPGGSIGLPRPSSPPGSLNRN